MEGKINKSKEYVVENFDIPKDAIFKIPKIIIDGNKKITIENHGGIGEFKRDELKINTSIGIIKLQGDSFEILYIGENTLIISGNLKNFECEGYRKYGK